MFNHDVEKVYSLVKYGTNVYIIGDPFSRHRYLRKGERGPDVLFLQKRLQQLGLFKLNPGGIYGFNTEQAIKEFQRHAKLAVTEAIGWRKYKTLRLLGEE